MVMVLQVLEVELSREATYFYQLDLESHMIVTSCSRYK